jgi:hypothetical protein
MPDRLSRPGGAIFRGADLGHGSNFANRAIVACPLTAEALPVPQVGRPRVLMRLAAAAVAVAVVAAMIVVVIAVLAPTTSSKPKRNPFGMGLREAAPAASGIGAYILALQTSFFRSLQAGIPGLRLGRGDRLRLYRAIAIMSVLPSCSRKSHSTARVLSRWINSYLTWCHGSTASTLLSRMKSPASVRIVRTACPSPMSSITTVILIARRGRPASTSSLRLSS